MRCSGWLFAVTLLLCGIPIAAEARPPGRCVPRWTSGDAWRVAAPLPTPRWRHGAAAVHGKIYAVGGVSGGGVLDAVDEYDACKDAWRPRASMPTPRSDLAVVAFGGRVYAIGGRDGAAILDTVEVYDPRTDSWASVDPLPVASAGLRAVAVKRWIYVIGGFDGTDVLGTVQRYDPRAGVWTVLSPMPTPKSDFAIAAFGRHIYAFFGAPREYPWGGGPFDVYDWTADTWAPTQLLGSDIGGPVAGILRDQIYVVGGEFAPGPNTVPDNREYDPAANTFERRAPMPTDRTGAAAAVVGRELYVLGGFKTTDPGFGTQDVVEAYTAPRRGRGPATSWSDAGP
ncbi:MAG TPA: kelch repeat-containing protein [Anaeromyxobacter sp.]|nr:kelch repeat-containing protein [Anaeromyxobacter sp.]